LLTPVNGVAFSPVRIGVCGILVALGTGVR
jgi:hypothetical protein